MAGPRDANKGNRGNSTPAPVRVKEKPVEKPKGMSEEPKPRILKRDKPAPEDRMREPRGPDDAEPAGGQIVVEAEKKRGDADETVQVDVPNLSRTGKLRED
ncbi:TPA: hypothetical protein EYP38_02985 [Candidatus Micrarchaeota archaeon]|nr:hypothetical protein [Candidatus Micrarchaeota archaeon]